MALLPDDISAADVLLQRPPTFKEILHTCAAYYNIDMERVFSGSTEHEVTLVRSVAFWLGRHYTRHSCEQMAQLAGRRTHHPCTQALNKIAGRLQVEERLRDDIDIIERRLAQTVMDWRFEPCR